MDKKHPLGDSLEEILSNITKNNFKGENGENVDLPVLKALLKQLYLDGGLKQWVDSLNRDTLKDYSIYFEGKFLEDEEIRDKDIDIVASAIYLASAFDGKSEAVAFESKEDLISAIDKVNIILRHSFFDIFTKEILKSFGKNKNPAISLPSNFNEKEIRFYKPAIAAVASLCELLKEGQGEEEIKKFLKKNLVLLEQS